MRVSGFMVPAEHVVTAAPTDTVYSVLDVMLEKHIGAVVVIKQEQMTTQPKDAGKEQKHGEETAMFPMPAGIITKSDILKAYHNGIAIGDPCELIMGDRDELVTAPQTMDRDKAARTLEKSHTHHLIVVDEEHAHFVGLVSSWDIAAECAKDDRAWPYLRSENGTIPIPKGLQEKIERRARKPEPPYDPSKPTTIDNHDHGKFGYMDDLDLMGFQ